MGASWRRGKNCVITSGCHSDLVARILFQLGKHFLPDHADVYVDYFDYVSSLDRKLDSVAIDKSFKRLRPQRRRVRNKNRNTHFEIVCRRACRFFRPRSDSVNHGQNLGYWKHNGKDPG